MKIKSYSKLYYSNLRYFNSTNTKHDLKEINNLSPHWITGFSDAEACFSVILTKRSTLKWRIMVSFEINLHSKDILILNLIKQYFGLGSVTTRKDKNLSVYRLTKIDEEVKVIIPHFTYYPLITNKYSDFILSCKVFNLILSKEHLTS